MTSASWLLRAALALCVLTPPPVAAPAAVVDTKPEDGPAEYEWKATVTVRFVQFTTWPESAFEDETSPVVVAVVGRDPFREHLDAACRDVKHGKRPIVVRRYERVEDVREAHLLFVPTQSEEELEALRERLGERPVVLVGDHLRFAERGGALAFFPRDATHFGWAACRQELARLRALRVQISSEVLKLAKMVDRVPPPEPKDGEKEARR